MSLFLSDGNYYPPYYNSLLAAGGLEFAEYRSVGQILFPEFRYLTTITYEIWSQRNRPVMSSNTAPNMKSFHFCCGEDHIISYTLYVPNALVAITKSNGQDILKNLYYSLNNTLCNPITLSLLPPAKPTIQHVN